MLLKNCHNVEQVIPFAAISQLIRPILKVGSEHANALKYTKINRGLKHGQQVLDVEVQGQTDDFALTGFQNLQD